MDRSPDSQLLPGKSRPQVSIRPMRQSDVSAVILLDAAVFGGQSRAAYFERRLTMIDRPDTGNQLIFLVADSGNGIIGFVMGTLTSGEFGLMQVTAIIDSIAVHPDFRRQHIGRRLIEEFLKQSARLGAKSAYTLVQWENWELLKVFHALGFSMPSTISLERPIG
jgi:ribosomal protein S18 acetylase RimI-like enzyme